MSEPGKPKRCLVISPIGDDSTPERAKQKKHANTVLKTFIQPALKGFKAGFTDDILVCRRVHLGQADASL
jgi:hypothetical protein